MYYRGVMITGVFGIPWTLLTILIFLVLSTISSVADPVPTDKNDPSICEQWNRVTVMKDVSYMETYQVWNYGYHEHKSRINYRSQNFTKWELKEMCCQGYEPHQLDEDAENCVPVCPSDCANGTCHRPNKCICNPGYFESIHNLTGFSVCQPNCTSGCHGGSCIEPEICSCNIGYISTENQTSCQASCIGVGGSGLENCGENASCIEPDTCKCDNGYAAFTNEIGVKNLSTWLRFSTKKIPLQITFNFNNFTCKPLCEPECEENADCIAPNKCQCTIGYMADSSSNDSIQCLPICEQNCHNSYCSSPNICTCHEGYKPHDLLGEIFCEPICQDDCINGKCTQPNYCDCAFGYEKLVIRSKQKQIVSENVCVPVCSDNCPNGRCIAPEQCHCNQGYVLKELKNQTDVDIMNTKKNIFIYLQSQKSCQPNCEPDCTIGYFCEAPNQCQIQYNNDKILNGFPKFRTRIINNIDDCGIGHVLIKNNKTVCSYKFNDTNCYEPNPCAVIMVDQQEKIKDFMNLRSIISVINETRESTYNVNNSENNQTFKWRMPSCTKECRILVSFGGFSKIVHEDDIIDCYQLKLHNETTGIYLRPKASANLIHRNAIRRLGNVWIQYPAICFLKQHFPSNTTISMKTQDKIETNVHVVIIVIIGMALTLVFIVALGVLLYKGRQKLSILRNFRGVSASNDTVMDGSMAQFSTREN